MADVEYGYGSKGKYPLHRPELVKKAVTMANWREHVAMTPFLLGTPDYDQEAPAAPGQNVWFCNALLALTEEEVLKLYRTLRATHKYCLEMGGDFTSRTVRERLPHLYGDLEKSENSTNQ